MDGPWDVRRVLGTVPVAADGSAYFTVPANTPIAVQPLDAEGKALQLMRSWFTAMPGEAVSCVGCHEQANDTPPERRPRASPASPGADHAVARPGARVQLGPRGAAGARQVLRRLPRRPGRRPAGRLRRTCAAPTAKLPLSTLPFPPSFYELRRFVRSPGAGRDPRVLPVADYHADTSPLVQMLRKGHHNVQLDEEAWDRLVTWIDMNAPAYGTWLEIPGVQGNASVRECRDRRIEARRRYGGMDEDPEAVPAGATRNGPRRPAAPARSQRAGPACRLAIRRRGRQTTPGRRRWRRPRSRSTWGPG